MTTTEQDWAEAPPNEDAFAMSGEGIGSDDLGAGNVEREGWYHFEIVDVKPELETLSKNSKEKTPSVLFYMTVRKTVEGQSPEGSKLYHRIYVGGKGGEELKEGSRNSAFRFGLGLGLLREVERDGQKSIVDAAGDNPKITIATWRRAKGYQCVAKITKDSDPKYGDRFQIPYGRVYRLDDPNVKDVAKDLDVWALAENFQPPEPGPSPDAEHREPEPAPLMESATPATESPKAVDPLDDLDDL